ncbi:MAG: DNA cytosine methyltransferase [Candidatus Aenigmarchaeota archaeon]|nr:DNA cytosine methyltransferase [Candidatus Aenigmarchaeota archaeon]
MKKLNVLDLFAGCGGLSKGFEKAGFNILAANEIWHPAAETHRMNHPNTFMVEGDITNQKIKQMLIKICKDKVDVIIGGPPCQAYSVAGRRDPTDPRGKLFEDYVDIVKSLKPSFFVMENVKGILSMMHDREDLADDKINKVQEMREQVDEISSILKHNKLNENEVKFYKERLLHLKKDIKQYQEKVTDMIAKRFKRIGYDMGFQVLNAADYGVPQKRERVIFIGTNTKKKITFPTPTHSMNPQIKLDGKKLDKWNTVAKAIGDLENKEEDTKLHHILPSHSVEFLKKIQNTPIGKSVFRNYTDAFYRCNPNEPSRTVKENHNGVFLHYSKDRVMTPRELARLQDFDDDFIFFGGKSSVLVQIGNAVPVGLAKAIASHVKGLINIK